MIDKIFPDSWRLYTAWKRFRPALALLYLPAVALTSLQAAADSLLCSRTIARLEKSSRLPQGLLTAIALAESGRFDSQSGRTYPWPWTVRAGDRGRYFSTPLEAVKAIKRLRQQGISNIDVGCMQINLHYHPRAFASIADAIDPTKNIAYAIQFLQRLKQRHKSWREAIAHYHSSTPQYAIPYQRKVLAIWKGIRTSPKSTLLATSQKPSQGRQAKPQYETIVSRQERLSRFAARARKRIDSGLKARRRAHEALMILHRNRFKHISPKRHNPNEID